MKKTSKTIKGKSWRCNVSYETTSNEEIRKQLEDEVKRRTEFMALLEERNQAEKKVSAVRIKITNSCIRLMKKAIRADERKLKALEKYSKS